MRVIRTISELGRIAEGGVLTIGNFDGVHLGHREILAAARQTADQRGTELVAMTFEPHPVAVLHPEKAPGVLTPLDLKTDLLAQCGVDCLIVLKDSRGWARRCASSALPKWLRMRRRRSPSAADSGATARRTPGIF
ncbi:MAG: adenylyltransferase/cytidyltransferase family protein [Chloroflexota bacterium]